MLSVVSIVIAMFSNTTNPLTPATRDAQYARAYAILVDAYEQPGANKQKLDELRKELNTAYVG